jgi:hypothetical protein
VIVGPTAIMVAVIGFALAPGPRRISDRFIIFFAIGFGWLMLLGWIPGLETRIDVPGVLLALTAGVAAANQFRNGRFRWSLRQWPLSTEFAAVAIGIAATLWFAVPIVRMNASGRLNALFPGWDNAAFFDMFKQILVHGGFNSIRSPGPGDGLPQTWAMLVRLWNPHPPVAVQWELNAYYAVLLLTLGAIVTVGCMSVARLCGRNFWITLPAMAAVVQVFVVGRLWIFNGYPTFDLPIAAVTAAVLLSWKRTLSPRLHFFAVAGLVLVAAYTWYPIVVLGAPAVTAATFGLIRSSPRRQQRSLIVIFVCIGVAFIAPFIPFHDEVNKASLSYASSGLQAAASFVPGTPWFLVAFSIAGLFLFIGARWFSARDEGLWVLAATAVVGTLGIGFLLATELVAAGHISYYGHKFADGVYGMSLIVLVTVVVSTFATSQLRQRWPILAVAVVACLASVALLEIDGYVSPFANPAAIFPTQAHTGFQSHEVIDAPPVYSSEAQTLIGSSQWAEDRPGLGTHWAFMNPDGQLSCVQADEWFFALSGELSLSGKYGEWDELPCRTGAGDAPMASYIVNHLGQPTESHVHLFVPASLAHMIVARDKTWRAPDVLYLPKTLPTS